MKTADADKNGDIRMWFLRSEEGSIFVIGCFLLILWIEAIILLTQLGHPMGMNMFRMGLVQTPVGRAASISYGTQAGMHPLLISFFAIYLDIMFLLIIYPMLIFSYKNLLERRFLSKHVKKVFESAQKNMTRFRRFKIVGVFAFVWFPFWMTGIMVGAVLGFLLGLSTSANLTTVILGTTSAVICWVYFFDKLFGWLGKVNESIPLIATVIIIAFFLVLRIINNHRESKEQKKPNPSS